MKHAFLQRFLLFVCLLCIPFILSDTAPTHPGRTDATGGHFNRKTGEYHYHGKKPEKTPVTPKPGLTPSKPTITLKPTTIPKTTLPEQDMYTCVIADLKQVYDGDTIRDVIVSIASVDLKDYHKMGEVFPGIILKKDGIYIKNDVRIRGIDTPEISPSAKHRTGVPRSATSMGNEVKAALASRDALVTLLNKNKLTFVIKNVEYDKYGRILADVKVGEINIAEYLLEHGHAIVYDGGTKPELNWETLDDGLMR